MGRLCVAHKSILLCVDIGCVLCANCRVIKSDLRLMVVQQNYSLKKGFAELLMKNY